MLSHDQKGHPRRGPFSLSLHPAGILSPDQRVAAVLQHRLYPTMSRGCWCCCWCCYCCFCCRGCCSGLPAETLYRDQRGGWTPHSRRRYWLPTVTSGPSCGRELSSRPRRRLNRGSSTTCRRCRLRCRVRWHRSSGRLASRDFPPN